MVFSIEVLESAAELSSEDQSLLEIAYKALKDAYAPYSKFNVGTALLLKNGEVVIGNNQENVAYPSGLCAERVALFAAGAQYPDIPVTTIAITAQSDTVSIDEPLAPCGACRQVMCETENRYGQKIKVLLKGDADKIYVINSVSDILPLSFTPDKLAVK
ncbi:MAG TPA: cytidine deaminase [Flavobacteriales bacterium]|nr:cytidine deaminase [Flavobacteriales bacterium]HIA10748.1 cytidine deaminase [Flavobacteriales bacterium]